MKQDLSTSVRVGKRIRMVRRLKDMSQTEAAETFGHTQETWSDIENAVRAIKVDELEQIARFFQVPIAFFFDDELRLDQIGSVNKLPKGKTGRQGNQAATGTE